MNTALNTRALALAGAATGALIAVFYNFFARPARGQV